MHFISELSIFCPAGVILLLTLKTDLILCFSILSLFIVVFSFLLILSYNFTIVSFRSLNSIMVAHYLRGYKVISGETSLFKFGAFLSSFIVCCGMDLYSLSHFPRGSFIRESDE